MWILVKHTMYNYKSIIVVHISSAAWVLEFVPPEVNSIVLIILHSG